MKSLIKQLREAEIQVRVENGDLKISAPKGAASPEIIQLLRANKAALVSYLSEAVSQPVFENIPLVGEQESYPLSSAQHRLWVLSHFGDANQAYNLSTAIRITEAIETKHFATAFQKVVARHDILRTIFKMDADSDTPRQYILPAGAAEFELEVINWTEKEVAEIAVSEAIQKDASHAFELSKGPLFKAKLFQLSDTDFVFFCNMHHIITDGWSMDVISKEVVQNYALLSQGSSETLPTLNLQYKDYAAWERKQIEGEAYQAARKFWLNRFDGFVPALDLPLDYPRRDIKTYSGASQSFQFDVELSNQLLGFCQGEKSTMFMGLLAAVNALLYRYSGQDDIVIGSPVAGRNHPDLEEQIGFYVNTLAMRTRFAGTDSFTELLSKVRADVMGSYEHQNYPFDGLIEELDLVRQTNRSALFDVLLVLQNTGDAQVDSGTTIGPFELEQKFTQFDLMFHFKETSEGLELEVDYNTDLFKSATVSLIVRTLKQLLTQALQAPDTAIAQLSIVAVDASNEVLSGLDRSTVKYDSETNIVSIFEAQAKNTPKAVALTFEGETMTYAALNEQSNQFAHFLVAEHQIEADDLIAVQLSRGFELIVSILAVLKSGAAYVPIDPEYPEQRRDYIRNDSQCKALVDQTFWDNYSSVQSEQNEENLGVDFRPDQLAYVIYTSGTTGAPKGVLIEHEQVVRLFFTEQPLFDFDATDVWTLFHSYCFDFSVWEIFGALLFGGKLVVVPQNITRDPDAYLELVTEEQVTVLNQTPSAFYNLIDAESAREGNDLNVRYVIFGGEALSPINLKPWITSYPECQMVNMYGITETTVHVTYKQITAHEVEHNISNIGKPIPTLSCWVLDGYQQVLPIGVPGELYVGGSGVTRGYLRRDELTAERFVTLPAITGSRLYRTGDKVKVLDNGELQYMGRLDDQVKIRGHRIEVGEIDQNLLQIASIEEAITIVREADGLKSLVSFLRAKTTLNAAELRSHLQQRIPLYAVPAQFVQVEQMPMTHHGKVDKKALVNSTTQALKIETEYVAADTKLQAQLVGLWEQVLGQDQVGIHDDFFHQGGDSIKALRMVQKVNDLLNIKLSPVEVYQAKTIASFSDFIEHSYDSENANVIAQQYQEVVAEVEALKAQLLPVLNERYKNNVADVFPMSDIQKGMVYTSLLNPDDGVYHDQLIYQRYLPEFNLALFEKAFAFLVQKHGLLRTAFNPADYQTQVQIVMQSVPVKINLQDISTRAQDEQEKMITAFMAEKLKQPFVVTEAPMWRMEMFDVGQANYVLIWEFHHSIMDGWSNASLMTDFNNIYQHLKEDEAFQPKMLKHTYKDLVLQQLVDKKDPMAVAFWQENLMDYSRLDLFVDQDIMSLSDQYAEKQLLAKLEALAPALQTSVRSITFAAYAYMLSVLSHEKDLVVGLVTNNRPVVEDSDKLVGCFLNTVPFRANIPDETTWREFLLQIEDRINEYKPFEKISTLEVAKIINERADSGNPIFDVIFNYVDFHVYNDAEQSVHSEANAEEDVIMLEDHEKTNTFMDLTVSPTGGLLSAFFRVTKTMKTGHDAAALCDFYFDILSQIVENTDAKVSHDHFFPAEERKRLLFDLNANETPYERTANLVDLFERSVETNPTGIAITDGTSRITYAEMDEQVRRLASYIVENAGQEQTYVIIHQERGINLIISAMAILRAGKAYAPIEPYIPANRKEVILDSIAWNLILTDAPNNESISVVGNGRGVIGNVEEIIANDAISTLKDFPRSQPEDIAYIIFTSGSTGVPKGVIVQHTPVVNVIEWVNKTFSVDENEKLLCVASISFDLSVYDIFGILAAGGCIRLAGADEVGNPDRLVEILYNEGITFWDSAPAALMQLVPLLQEKRKQNIFGGLRMVFLSGDWIPVTLPDDLKASFPGVNVISLGGATEATIWSNFYPIEKVEPHWTSIPYGRPIQNARYYVLDEYLKACPVGVSGDLYIGGEVLAMGYNDLELSTKKFIANPHIDGERIYLTGDKARFFPDGNLEFLGRVDDQVKVRGYRVEMGEIEVALLNIEAIHAAVVVAKADQTKQKTLFAYYVSSEEITSNEIKAELRESLPDYMIPAAFIRLEKMPTTSNGKLNKKALPDPFEIGDDEVKVHIIPSNNFEQKIHKAWTDVLGGDAYSIDDNFFEVGGDSLKIMQLRAAVQNNFDIHLKFSDLFAFDTIQALADFVEQQKSSTAINFSRTPDLENRYEPFPLTPVQRSYFVGREDAFELGTSTQLYFEEDLSGFDYDKLNAAFRTLIERHDMLRVVFIENGTQQILPFEEVADYKLPLLDLSGNSADEKEAVLQARRHEISNQKMDLMQWPQFDICLLQNGEKELKALVAIDIIIVDDYSVRLLMQDLASIYSAQNLPELNFSFRDYVMGLEDIKSSEDYTVAAKYWQDRLSTLPLGPEIPTKVSPDTIVDLSYSDYSGLIAPEKWEAIRNLASKHNASPTILMVSAFSMVLKKWTGKSDFMLNLTLFNRLPFHTEVDGLVGDFTASELLEVNWDEQATFGENLNAIQAQFLSDMDHSYFSGVEVNQMLARREGIYNRLLTPVVVTSVIESDELTKEQRETAYEAALNEGEDNSEVRTAQVWLDHQIIAVQGFVNINWTVVDGLFPDGMIQEMFDAYLNLVHELAAGNRWDEKSQLTTPADLITLVTEANDTAQPFEPASLISGILKHAATEPERIAVTQGDDQITYGQLDELSSRVATWLQLEGAKPNELIAVVSHKSWWQVVAVVGIHKSGAAYLPVDAALPQKRIEYLIENVQCTKALRFDAVGNLDFDREGLAVLDLSHDRLDTVNGNYNVVEIDPASLAYVIYTSGSTGNPKGVMIDHKSALNTCEDINSRFEIGKDDAVLGVSSLSFDLSVYDIFGILHVGAKLVLPLHSPHPDPVDWINCIEQERVTVWNSAPALADILTQSVNGNEISRVASLRVAMMSGDWIPLFLPRKLWDLNGEMNIYSLGGATEASIWSIYFPIAKIEDHWKSIPYGKGLGNQKFYVFDESLNLSPFWTTGDLYIAGQGLALGYWNDAEKTASSFFKHPVTGEALYRTGDRGRLLPDGNIEFMGRVDTQVKIRGHRIELGEIENCLFQYEGVSDVVCAVKKDHADAPMICSYYVADHNLDEQAVKTFLEAYLPAYMTPRFFIKVEALPLNANGKVDRKQLPEPAQEAVVEKTALDLNETEQHFVDIVIDLLGIPQPRWSDNFFDLGGDSLKAAQLINRVNKTFGRQLGLGDLFFNPELGEFYAHFHAEAEEQEEVIPTLEVADDYPASAGQKRLWLLGQFQEASVAYNIPAAFTIEGKLEMSLLDDAFAKVIEHHESLRTVLRQNEAGELRQHVLSSERIGFELQFIDASAASDPTEEARTQTSLLSQTTFDLANAPLFKAALIKTGDESHVLAFVIHHIISDGWSMSVLARDLFAAMRDDHKFEALPIQYKEFAVWQNNRLSEQGLDQHRAFWTNEFGGEIPVINLFYDKPRPAIKTYAGDLITRQVDSDKLTPFKAILRKSDSTLYMGLISLVNAVLYRYTSQEDIVLGSPIAGRDHQQLEDQIGFFVNTLALRTHLLGDEAFPALLARVKNTVLQAFDHQLYPFEQLVEDLDLDRDTSRSPLFDVMVILQNASVQQNQAEPKVGDVAVDTFDMGWSASQFDLSFTFSEEDGGLYLGLNYNTDLFFPETIERLADHVVNLMESILLNLEMPINTLSMTGAAEKQLLQNEFNATSRDYPLDLNVVDLFEQQANLSGDKTALVVEDRTITYAELDRLSSSFAHFLREEYSIQQNDLVGVMLPREEWLIIALIGVLKTSASYVPIDPNYPEERVAYIREDSGAKHVVEPADIAAFLAWDEQRTDTAAPSRKIQKDALAYVIYTSGSTGLPKGVMISHGNASAMVYWAQDEFKSSPFDMTYAVTSVCFDLSIFEIFFTLSTGKSIRMLSNALDIPKHLVHDQNVLLNTVPSVVNNLLQEGVSLDNVNVLNMAGEPIPMATILALDCDRIQVRNLYGPSEDTTYSTVFKLSHDQPVLIGKPIHNTQAYILDDALQMQALGVPGELCLSGEGLSLGYLHREELTAEKFIPHPFFEGERMYRTGDVARWRADGNLEFLGRKDDQVKIRGFRIELGEIEKVLQEHKSVEEAVVLARDTEAGGKLLVGFVVGTALETTNVKAFLMGKLPEYMVPTYLFDIQEVPVTPNGKTDKKALLKIASERFGSTSVFVAPRNDTEEQVLEIWREVLENGKMGVTDNFFELGGHSLLAARVINRLNRQFRTDLTIKEIFGYPTVSTLSGHVRERNTVEADLIPVLPVDGAFPVTSAQEKIWLGAQMAENNRAFNLSLYNEFDLVIEGEMVARVFNILIQRHPVMRSRFYLEGKRVYQEVMPFDTFDMPHEVVEMTDNATDQQYQSTLEDLGTRTLDLENGPIFKVYTLKSGNKTGVLLVIHHLICDGIGLQLITDDVVYIMQNLDSVSDIALGVSTETKFREYATWLDHKVNSPDFQDRKYWQSVFEKPSNFKVDSDFELREDDEFLATIHEDYLDADKYSAVKQFCKERNSSQNQFLLSALFGLSYRLYNTNDIVVTVPTNGRNNFQLESMLGHLVQLLPIRIDVPSEISFNNLLDKVQDTFLESMSHLNYSLDLMENEIEMQQDSPLRNLGFLHQSQYEAMGEHEDRYDIGSEHEEDNVGAAQQFNAMTKLLLQTVPDGNRLWLAALYNQNLFKPETVAAFVKHYITFIEQVLESPDQPLSTIKLIQDPVTSIDDKALEFELEF
jgi:amino acid adenylation domain-containing protein